MKNRNYSLDALRAIMMLLGIVVHACSTYTTLGVFPQPIHDVHANIFYDFVVLFIHSFRMPVFFVLSGFFTALLYNKKGLQKTMVNRINRIVLPFLASMILIAPLVKMLIMYYAKGMSWAEILHSVKTLQIYINIKTGHLWFLYYLIIIFMICHIVKSLKLQRVTDLFNRLKKRIFVNPSNSNKIILIFSILSCCFILPQQQGFIDTSIDFIPDPLLLLTYLVYFIFGYMLFSFKDHLRTIFSGWKIHLSFACILMLLYFCSFIYANKNPSFIQVGIASFLCTVLSWLMIFGLFGLFLNKLNHESKTLSFISKSSYWIYLTHLPVTILLGGLFLNYPVPHFVKCFVIITLTYFALILVYKLIVEKTFIGRFLNGKK